MATARGRVYVRGAYLQFEEDETHEFKGHREVAPEDTPPWVFRRPGERQTRRAISRNLNAFLNTGRGGVVYCGVDDRGRVLGLHLTRYQKDHVRLSVRSLLLRYRPAVPSNRHRVTFVPVVSAADANSPPSEFAYDVSRRSKHHLVATSQYCWCDADACARSVSGVIPLSYVIEIEILPWPDGDKSLHPFYLTESGQCYVRRQASVMPLTAADCIRITRHQAAALSRRQTEQMALAARRDAADLQGRLQAGELWLSAGPPAAQHACSCAAGPETAQSPEGRGAKGGDHQKDQPEGEKSDGDRTETETVAPSAAATLVRFPSQSSSTDSGKGDSSFSDGGLLQSSSSDSRLVQSSSSDTGLATFSSSRSSSCCSAASDGAEPDPATAESSQPPVSASDVQGLLQGVLSEGCSPETPHPPPEPGTVPVHFGARETNLPPACGALPGAELGGSESDVPLAAVGAPADASVIDLEESGSELSLVNWGPVRDQSVMELGASGIDLCAIGTDMGVGETDLGAVELNQSISEAYLGSSEIEQGISGAYLGTSEIDQSTSEIYQGASEIDQSTSEIPGTSEIDQSTSEIYQGASEIDQSTSEIPGTSEIDQSTSEIPGTSEIDQSTSEIYQGTSEIDQSTSEAYLGASDIDQGTSEEYQSASGEDLVASGVDVSVLEAGPAGESSMMELGAGGTGWSPRVGTASTREAPEGPGSSWQVSQAAASVMRGLVTDPGTEYELDSDDSEDSWDAGFQPGRRRCAWSVGAIVG